MVVTQRLVVRSVFFPTLTSQSFHCFLVPNSLPVHQRNLTCRLGSNPNHKPETDGSMFRCHVLFHIPESIYLHSLLRSAFLSWQSDCSFNILCTQQRGCLTRGAPGARAQCLYARWWRTMVQWCNECCPEAGIGHWAS